jgi:ATP-binding cassette subfamily F protein uup
MPLLTLDRACLAFGHVPLLDQAAMQIDTGDRIALIGRNGSGKSSLLRALAGLASLDDGVVWRQSGIRLAYVAQEPEFDPECTIFETISGGLGEISGLLMAYHEAALGVATDPSSAALLRLQDLQCALEHADGWRIHMKVEQAIHRLKLDPDARIGVLSGGGKKRVALSRALAMEPELLLLDEPTNHLDFDGITWLETLIQEFRGGVVVITHDRTFLDAVATRVIELDRGRLNNYPGSFDAYQQRKTAEIAAETQQNAKFDKFLAQEEVWIRKGVEARRTRNEGRVLRLEFLRKERVARRDRVGNASLKLDRGDQSGRMVAELSGVSKFYDGKPIVRNFDVRIMRGDRVGFIGPNGAGKTTLLKLILGEIQPDSGVARLGSRVEVAYFDQFRTALDENATLADVISPGSEYVEIAGVRKHVVGYLGDFLFSPERARSPVRSLSGGERNRLLLARLFARPANVLVLDEPTNDLDIETLELLESLLQDYSGTIFLVSHDRRFLDNVVTQSICAESEGCWGEYVGGFGDWQRALERKPVQETVAPRVVKQSLVMDLIPAGSRKSGPAKLSYRELKELEGLPDQIARLEGEQAEISIRLADPAIYRSASDERQQLQMRSAWIVAELEKLMLRWEDLESRASP